MLPPSDSWLHQNLKIQEALENIKSIEVPPPAYMATQNSESFVNQSIEDYIEDGEEDVSSMPISIAIDASLAVEGQNNNIILPESSPTSKSQEALEADGSVSTNTTRISLLTEAVLKALESSDILRTSGVHQRPINLSINASIRVKGDKNLIFSGPKPMKKNASGTLARQGIVQEKDQHSTDGQEYHYEATKKRRAESACCPMIIFESGNADL
jgi:hypothetical protein